MIYILFILFSSLAFSQSATQLRGKNIENPLAPLNGQGLGWVSTPAPGRWHPTTFSTANGAATYCPSSSASTTAYTCSTSPTFTVITGTVLTWKPDLTNTAAATLNANALGAVAINKLSAGALVAVGAGDISNQYIYLIRYNGSVWILESAGSGGGSSGGCNNFTRTSGTVLTMLSNATLSTTCKIGEQNVVYTFSAPITATVSAGTSDVFFYVTAAGVLTVGHNALTIVCAAGSTCVTPITAFPQGVSKLYQWHVTAGVWDATGTDSLVNAQGDPLTAGSGITLATSSGATTISADCTSVVTSFTGAGTPGNIAASCLNSDYLNTTNGDKYVCNNAGGGCNTVAAGQWVLVTGSAGSSGINIFREETSAIAMTGSDVDIYSVSVPALAAGKGCSITWGIETSVAANVLTKVKFGSDSLASVGAIIAAGIWKHSFSLGNVAADNTHQRIAPTIAMVHTNDANLYQEYSGTAITSFTQNWGSAVTLKITASSATGGATVTGRWLSILCP